MSVIRPFRAYRPLPGIAARVASPPYDVINSEEARRMAAGNPFSFLHVGKPEIDLPPELPHDHPSIYEKGRENLHRMIEDGTLVRDRVPTLSLYRQRMGDHVQTGLCAACSVSEYESGLIKRHEHTRRDKEDDRARHVTVCDAQAEPVFLAYRAVPGIDRQVEAICARPPAVDVVTEDGVGHTVWVVDDPGEVQRLVESFAGVPALYVADGHHRTAAAVRHAQGARSRAARATGREPFESFMAVVFPHDQLRILDYNRVVRDLAGMSAETFLERVAERFEVGPPGAPPRPEGPRRFGLYLDGSWRRLAAKPGTFPAGDPVNGLDVAILQHNLLQPVLGIADPRTDTRIDFVGGIRGTAELERRCADGWAAAFSLHPTSLDQLMAVADAGEVMPPKSTWFEPKLRSGLMVRLLDE